jgi:hypothetical protein
VALSSGHKGETIRRLPVEDVQVPVHVIDDVRSRFITSPSAGIDIEVFCWPGQNVSKLLNRTGGHNVRLPRVLDVPLHYDNTREASYRGRYADFWKGEHRGQIFRLPSHKVLLRVVKGERPLRRTKSADSLWGMLDSCWARCPNTEDVL